MSFQRVYNTFDTYSSPTPNNNPPLNDVRIQFEETYTSDHTFPILMELKHAANADDFMKCCIHCKKMYKEDENGLQSCCYHKGSFRSTHKMSGYQSHIRWSCCKAERSNEPGCCIRNHEEDTRMTGLLNTFKASLEAENRIKKVSSSSSYTTEEEDEEEDGESFGLRPENAEPADLVVWDTPDEDEENDEIGTELSPMHHKEEIEPAKIQIKEKKEKIPKIHSSKKENNGKNNDTIHKGPVKHQILKSDTLQGISLKYNVSISELKKANKIFSEQQLWSFKFITIPTPEKV